MEDGNYNLGDIVTWLDVGRYQALSEVSNFDESKTKFLVEGFNGI